MEIYLGSQQVRSIYLSEPMYQNDKRHTFVHSVYYTHTHSFIFSFIRSQTMNGQ